MSTTSQAVMGEAILQCVSNHSLTTNVCLVANHGERRKQTVLGSQRPLNARKEEDVLMHINLVPD